MADSIAQQATPATRPGRNRPWELAFFLAVVGIYLAVSLLAPLLRGGASEARDGARRLKRAETRLGIRIYSVIRHETGRSPWWKQADAEKTLSGVISNLKRGMRADPGDVHQRFALAVAQRELGRPATDTLASLPPGERYRVLRGLVLDAHPELSRLRSQGVREFIELNPARFLWMESLYRRAGDAVRADAASADGYRDARPRVIAYLAVIGCGGLLGFAGLVAALALYVTRRPASTIAADAAGETGAATSVMRESEDFPTGPPPPPPVDPSRISLADGTEILLAWLVIQLVFAVGLSLVGSVVAMVPAAMGGTSGDAEVLLGNLMTPVSLLAGVCAAPLAVLWLWTRKGHRVPIGWRLQPAGRLVLWGLSLLSLGGALTFAASIVVSRFGHQPQQQVVTLIADVQGTPLRILVLVAAAVLVPIAEETVFRGALLRGLRTYWGPVAAVVVSSAVFAAVHGDPIAAIGIFCLALVLAWGAQRTGSLLPSAIAHGLFNLVQLLLLYVMVW